MSAKHTPGPWRPVEDAQGICGLMDPQRPGVAVAWFSVCHVPANGYVGEGRGMPERQANARLVLASIDMLAALKKIVEMNRQTAKDQYGDPNRAEGWACVTVARAAIAKAEPK